MSLWARRLIRVKPPVTKAWSLFWGDTYITLKVRSKKKEQKQPGTRKLFKEFCPYSVSGGIGSTDVYLGEEWVDYKTLDHNSKDGQNSGGSRERRPFRRLII